MKTITNARQNGTVQYSLEYLNEEKWKTKTHKIRLLCYYMADCRKRAQNCWGDPKAKKKKKMEMEMVLRV